ncbi:MAG: hypothetical protein ACLPYZ_13555 [Limisphaerales bacterium]
MKWFGNPCRRHRESLCFLAGGALAEREMSEIRAHLADCVDCRKYHDEMVSLAKPLADWERNFAHIKPTPETQIRWEKAIQAAADVNRRKQTVHELTFAATLANAIRLSFLKLVWPCRRTWTALAAVWIALFIFNVSQRDKSELAARKLPPPSPEAIIAWRQQERLLAELIGPSAPGDAEQRKIFLPKPRTENAEAMAV